MEASVAESAPIEAQAENPEQIFKYNAWVHVGPGAAECEHIVKDDAGKVIRVNCPLERETVALEQRHFHAWLRLPNQFAYRDISEKAQAARARKQRQLRDPDSDARAILEDEIDGLRENVQAMVDEVVYSKFNDGDNADTAVREREEFEHIDQDVEELARLDGMPEEERDTDAYDTLKRHVDGFSAAVGEEVEKVRARRAESLAELPVDELADQVRKLRIERQGISEFLHVSNYWVWYVGTMEPLAGTFKRKFANISQLTNAPGEVISALQVSFSELEANLSPMGRAKNS